MACSLVAPQGVNSSCQRRLPAPRAAQRAALLLLHTPLPLSSKQRLSKAAGFRSCRTDTLQRRWQQRRLRTGVAVCVAAAATRAAAAAAATELAAAAAVATAETRLGAQQRGPQPLQHLCEHRLQQKDATQQRWLQPSFAVANEPSQRSCLNARCASKRRLIKISPARPPGRGGLP